MDIKDQVLMKAAESMLREKLEEFNAQELANTAWAFEMLGRKEEERMEALGRATVWKLWEFNAQNLVNTAWAFATARHPAPRAESIGYHRKAIGTMGTIETIGES